MRRRELVLLIQTSAALVIHRPLDEVFRVATDLSTIPLWVPGAQVRLLSSGPVGEGTRFEETLMRFGRAVIAVVEVKNYRVSDGFEFQTITAPFPLLSSIGGLRFAATPDGTQVTLSHRVRIVPWLRPLEPLLRRVSQAQSQHAVQTLKSSVES